MALRKFQSLDYSGSGSVGVAGRRTPARGDERTVPSLSHSVSIVVELALGPNAPEAELEAAATQAGEVESRTETGAIETRREEAGRGTSAGEEDRGEAAEGEEEDDEEEEGDDEDDDVGSCLSSKLAQRVVIVDEADKIIRTRAHSAEPRVEAALVPALSSPVDTCRAPDGHQAEAGRARATCGGAGGLAWAPKASCGSASSVRSNGELAERGELLKLGMRRNTLATHNHRQLPWAPDQVDGGANMDAGARSPLSPPRSGGRGIGTDCRSESDDDSGGSSNNNNSSNNSHDHDSPIATEADARAQLEPSRVGGAKWQPAAESSCLNRRHSHLITHTSSSLSAPRHGVPFSAEPLHKYQTISPANSLIPASGSLLKSWHQRRQSLQISLLTGGPLSSPCKSLNEEELRGEREFNEQVRSAKSPELFHLHHHHHHHQQSPSAGSSSQHRHHSSLLQLAQQHSQSQASQQQQQQQLRQEPTVRSKSTSGAPDLPGDRCGQCDEPQAEHQVSSSRQYQRNISIRGKQSQQQAKQRRVSFSCVDPVIRRGSSALATSEHLAGCRQAPFKYAHLHRASVAYYPSAAHSPTRLDGGPQRDSATCPADSDPDPALASILKNSSSGQTWARLQTPLSCSASASASSSSVCARDADTFGAAASLAPPPASGAPPRSATRTKRHSLATHSLSGLIPSTGADELAGDTREDLAQRRRLSLCVPSKTPERTAPPNCPESGQRMSEQAGQQQQASGPTKAPATQTEPTESTRGAETKVDGVKEKKPIKPASSESEQTEREKVQTIMANARLRQEQFAKLLEEHEQIVNEINRFETKISSSQTNLQSSTRDD